MRIFFDTEFSGLREDSILVSIGLVADDHRECYVELLPTGLHVASADDFVQSRVLAQFGKIGGARVANRIEMSDRVTAFLSSFHGQVDLYFAGKLDWQHLETLIEPDRTLMARLQARDITGEASGDMSRAAAAAMLIECSSRGIGEHHALADALALQAAWDARR